MLRMISTLTGSFVLQQFKHSNTVEIHIPFQSWLHWLAAVAPWYRSQGSGHRWSSVEDRCLPGSDSCSPAWWQILKNTSMHKLGNYHSWVISSRLLPWWWLPKHATSQGRLPWYQLEARNYLQTFQLKEVKNCEMKPISIAMHIIGGQQYAWDCSSLLPFHLLHEALFSWTYTNLHRHIGGCGYTT